MQSVRAFANIEERDGPTAGSVIYTSFQCLHGKLQSSNNVQRADLNLGETSPKNVTGDLTNYRPTKAAVI